MKIDTTKWENIPVTDLFELSLPKGDIQVKGLQEGTIPLITPSNFNNGLIQRIPEDSKSTLYDKGCLTVDMFGNAYYQEEPFFVTAHGHVNVLIPKKNLSKRAGLFIATSIKSMFIHKYSFNDMCTQKVLKNEKIGLPVTGSHTPDWEYMENYMEKVEDAAKQNLVMLLKTEPEHRKIDSNKWEEFQVKDLFKSYTGGDMLIQKMKEGDIPLISHSLENNGVAKYVAKQENVKLYNHTYTLSVADRGNFGARVQVQDFYIGTRVKALELHEEYREYATFYTLQYLSSTINAVASRFDYRDNCTDRMDTLKFKLPVLAKHTPDWSYMENYMRKVEMKAQDKIKLLNM